MRGNEFFREAAKQPPFSRLHPKIGVFFNNYFANEKVIPLQGKYVINTQFPPYPSPAFDNLAEHFKQIGDQEHRQLYSVTLAITNRCNYHCWHCYNAGREQKDLSLSELAKVIKRIQELGAVMVTLTGGEPLLRNDLEHIAGLFNSTSCLTLNTTGYGLTLERAQSLKKNGVFAIGISLDSDIEEVHDTLRGKKGAFQTALQALKIIKLAKLYPYIITVASHDLIQPARFNRFLKFAKDSGALEIHLLEPCATGKLTGHSEAVLSDEDRQLILQHQKRLPRMMPCPFYPPSSIWNPRMRLAVEQD